MLVTSAAAARAPLRVSGAAGHGCRWKQPARRPLGVELGTQGRLRRSSLTTKEVRLPR